MYRSLAAHFDRLIRDGVLRPGDRLPTARALSQANGLNKATICQGFAELQRQGLIVSRPGRGTYVAGRPPQAVFSGARVAERVESLYRQMPPHPQPGAAVAGQPQYDFSALWPEPGLFPLSALRPIFERLLRDPDLLQYGSAQGYGPLCDYLRERAGREGVPGEVIVVQGSQQGIDLIFRAYLNPGDAVAVESPTYASVLPHLAFHQARVVPIPMTGEGLDLEALENAVHRDRVKMVYAMPNFQNPTGITMAEARREALSRLAAATGILIVEDDFEHDLRFAGRQLHPIAGRSDAANVIYLSSFSKSLLPGLRVGWMVAPSRLIEPLVLARKYTDICAPVLMQAVLLEFCRSGRYERHLKRARKVCRERVELAHRALREAMPGGTASRMPEGGFSLWVTLPEGFDAEGLAWEAARNGVRITPGSHFDPAGRPSRSFRLALSLAGRDGIVPGIRILGRLLRESKGPHRSSTTDNALNTLHL